MKFWNILVFGVSISLGILSAEAAELKSPVSNMKMGNIESRQHENAVISAVNIAKVLAPYSQRLQKLTGVQVPLPQVMVPAVKAYQDL